MGWFSMAIVDVLDFLPEEQTGRDQLIDIQNRMAGNLPGSRIPKPWWYQVLDLSGDEGNYIETSCTAMFAYSIFKESGWGTLIRNTWPRSEGLSV
jgi:unsaturated rhamnogalacturonyl hydrolase